MSAVVLATATVCFALFHAVSHALVGGLGTSRPHTPVTAHLLRRVTALVLLGCVPAVVAAIGLPGGLAGIGLRAGDLLRGGLAVVALSAVVVPVLWGVSKQSRFQEQYPQIRNASWTPRLWALSAGTWAVYLMGYETFFRGFLLFGLVEPLGVWPAVWLNTALYVAVHADKQPSEVLACIPMGLLFCGLALWTGAVWAPFGLHLVIALTAETGGIVRGARAAPDPRPGPIAPRR